MSRTSNRIELFILNQAWYARFVGPQAQVVRSLFDTDTIPTPYASSARAEDVQAHIESRNPGMIVIVLEQVPYLN